MSACTPSREANDLIIEHERWARGFARYVGKRVNFDQDDAVSCGLLGLTEAAQRYDASKGAFKAFARFRIEGEIIDQMRRDAFVGRSAAAQGVHVSFVSIDQVWSQEDERSDERHAVPAVQPDLDSLIDLKDSFAPLTPRERQVLCLLGEGLKGREIGERLGVTESRISQIASVARQKAQRSFNPKEYAA